jgi:RHS repeat-associated protein
MYDDSVQHAFPAHKFTGKERDTESGLDNFGARYFASSVARFMTPDRAHMASVDPCNPQSWNLYAYVLNNPLTLVDPNGLNPCDSGGTVVASRQEGSASGEREDPCRTRPPSPPDIDPCQAKPESCYQQEKADSVAGGLAVHDQPCLLSSLRTVVASGEVPGGPNGGYGTPVRGTVIAAPPDSS